ncbi:hypothetical protein I310019A7_15720 [Lawsonibacter asaccharolyticus]
MERLLSILLQREKITAPDLVEQFEVSRRTIQRDIESLCRAGMEEYAKDQVYEADF